MSGAPTFTASQDRAGALLALAGDWTIGARELEDRADALVRETLGARAVTFDCSSIGKLDTGGAWTIDRALQALAAAGASVAYAGASREHAELIEAARFRAFAAPPRAPRSVLLDYLADMGAAMRMAGGDVVVGVAFLGRVVATVAAAAARPSRFRRTSVSHHLEQFGVRSVPIIALINFLVGGIVAQQGIFQLASFGAQPFAVDLVGILVLRELGVLLTSIMMAGRSGSAITAEIGSMKMREEIDAIVVMGLDPMETLVAPRAIALALALPLLTFVADMAGLFGGALVAWSYAGIPPVVYFARIKAAIGVSTFLSGLIKAPFMALVIALIATREGLAVGGSAESLGRRVTESVVKAIFMVIVIDGLFAVFFAAIDF